MIMNMNVERQTKENEEIRKGCGGRDWIAHSTAHSLGKDRDRDRNRTLFDRLFSSMLFSSLLFARALVSPYYSPQRVCLLACLLESVLVNSKISPLFYSIGQWTLPMAILYPRRCTTLDWRNNIKNTHIQTNKRREMVAQWMTSGQQEKQRIECNII